jgi:hypothetical protein
MTLGAFLRAHFAHADGKADLKPLIDLPFLHPHPL